jgi:hypothetical protein
MRDPARIEALLSLLRQVWEQSPDLRLGQLLLSAVRPEQPCPEIFHIEYDRLAEGLRELWARLDSADKQRG